MAKWGLYRSLVTAPIASKSDIVRQARDDFAEGAQYNPAYAVATIGANEISILLRSGDNAYMKMFNAAYDSGILVGDVLAINGTHYMCTELSNADDVTLRGSLYECNLMLRFQLGTSAIVERWSIFDSGVYSTTLAETPKGQVGDTQFKLLLPYDSYTCKLQRDKRLATEVLYHVSSTPTLRCYRVTSNDSKASDFGHGKILELKLREDQFAPSKDNVELLICDYIATTAPAGTSGGGWV